MTQVADFSFKESYGLDDLREIMCILRSENGCPWDREQTHETIRMNFIEEVYEAIEGIDRKDSELLCEELGDVLLQIVFHAQMEQEAGRFSMDDVIDGICKKLIVRHPHIFADVVAEDTATVLNNWDEIKKKTKKQQSQTDVIRSVSPALPALMRSQKVQQKAAKAGFDWPDVSGALDKLEEEIAELREAIAQNDAAARAEELGDVLFSAVNVARFIGVDSELALTGACEKFIRRFSGVEKLAAEKETSLTSMTLAQLDELWDEAKQNECSTGQENA